MKSLDDDKIIVPTNDRRHIAKIRFGKLSGEIFCRDPVRRDELGLPPIPTPETDDLYYVYSEE